MSEQYPGYARTFYSVLKYNGVELGVSKQVESIEYTDNASGTLDQISITLNDRDGIAWQPEKGADLDVTIYLENWFNYGAATKPLKYHCGNFVVDDITITGNPWKMIVKAVSEPANGDFKNKTNTKTWEKTTLKAIATEFLGKYGMTKMYFNGPDQTIDSIEQSDKTDSAFLKEVCEKYGYDLKVYKVGFVIFKEEAYEGNAKNFYRLYLGKAYEIPDADYPLHEMQQNYTWNSTLQGTYTGAIIKYTDPKTGKTVKSKVGKTEPKTLTVGSTADPTRVLYINQKASSIAEAELIAKNKVNAENKKAVTFTMSPALFNPFINASNCIDVKKSGRINGRYFIDTVSVSYGSGGLTETFKCHKVFERL